jgi:hypothetical protein
MADFLLALQFWLLYELLSWPLRLALSTSPMPADVRRLLSRVAGPAMLALPVWVLAHGLPVLGVAAAWVWIVVALLAGAAVAPFAVERAA